MKIEIIKGGITKQTVDAIVNAANTSLLGGGGVDGAIHRAGGPAILDECMAIRARQGGCKVGEVVYTSGGDMDINYVIHTVGPKWNKGRSNEAEKLLSCYVKSLELAELLGCKSVAFPNISTGIYGYQKDAAAKIAVAAVTTFESKVVERVLFVCFDEENYEIYEDLI